MLAALPLGSDAVLPVPPANPLACGRVALGRRLFFDVRLSRQRATSCATCHDPKRAFTDGRVLPIGDGAALTDLMAGLAKAQTLSADDFNKNSLSGTEKVSSVYVLANLKLGVVEVQPGLRYEHTDIHDTFWNQVTNPDDSPGASAFASNQTTYDFVLPSVHANYRPDAETVVRASVWRRSSAVGLGGVLKSSSPRVFGRWRTLSRWLPCAPLVPPPPRCPP